MPIPLGILAAGAGGPIAYRTFFAKDASNTNYRGMATDASENIFQAGADGSIIKSDKFGTVLWGRKLDTVAWRDCAVDSNNDVIVVGRQGSNGVVAKYNSSGVIQWQRTIALSPVTKIVIDNGGNFYLAGDEYSNAGAAWAGEFTSSLSRNYMRVISGISQQGDICFYNGSVWVSAYYYTGSPNNRFENLLWGFNSSGTTIQRYFTASNITSTLGGGVQTDGTFLYHFPQPEISGQYQQSVVKLNSSYVIQASRNYQTSNSSYGQAYDSVNGMLYVNTSAQVFKLNTSLTTQFQRSLSNLVDGNFSIRGTSYYVPAGSGFMYKLPQDGSDTGTYTVSGSSVTYSSISLTETSPIAGASYINNSYTSSSLNPTISASSYTDSSYTPTREITGV